MVECNKLVFKSQLLNQLSCLSVTETGMLGHLVNKGMDGADLKMQIGSCLWSQVQNGTQRQAYKQEQMLAI